MLSWCAIVTTVVSWIEQALYIHVWRDLFTAYYIRKQANVHSENPRLWIALTFGMYGLDLAIFWISMSLYRSSQSAHLLQFEFRTDALY